MARPEGFEPPTPCSGGTCSIHLSYGRAGIAKRAPLNRSLSLPIGSRCAHAITGFSVTCQLLTDTEKQWDSLFPVVPETSTRSCSAMDRRGALLDERLQQQIDSQCGTIR